MELESSCENVENCDIKDKNVPRTPSRIQDEGKAQKRSKQNVLFETEINVWGISKVFAFILNVSYWRSERDLIKSYKNTVEEFNQTINSLQDSYTDLMTEKHQLQDNFNSLSQKKLELETRIKDLTDEKDQLQRDFDSLNKKGTVCFFMSTELKSWSDCRQYCRDRGADLVIINTEEKQVSLFSERVWIGLSDTENEGIMKWVDNSPLKQGFWFKGEPNNSNGNEDCIELNYNREETGWSPLNSWNDYPCSEKKKGICEK
uniref:C-type lectin domain family 4 member M-like n=1 Tax=Sinocyclocheilus rhinocerous TaxID=307959 RepID=A0A673KXP1_9TELE